MINLDPKELRIDTFHTAPASGWVAKAENGVRVTHLPSGVYVEEKAERSQHKNKVEAYRKLEIALALLPPEALVLPSKPEEDPELTAITIRKAFIEYRGEAMMTSDEAFIFAAGFIAGRETK